MLERKKISDILKQKKIKEKYNIKRVRLFWSYSRWEATKNSDIDLLIDYEKPIDIVLFFKLKKELKKILWVEVDVINNKFMKNEFKKYIKKDLITVL